MFFEEFNGLVPNHLDNPSRRLHLRTHCSGLAAAATQPMRRQICYLCLEYIMDRISAQIPVVLRRVHDEQVILTERDMVYVPAIDGELHWIPNQLFQIVFWNSDFVSREISFL